MSVLQETHPHTFNFSALTRASLAFVVRMWRAWRNRIAVAKLADLDDHALRDIGLTIHDVRSALSVPARNDPSLRLAALASERWHADRAFARERLQKGGNYGA